MKNTKVEALSVLDHEHCSNPVLRILPQMNLNQFEKGEKEVNVWEKKIQDENLSLFTCHTVLYLLKQLIYKEAPEKSWTVSPYNGHSNLSFMVGSIFCSFLH